MLSSSPDVKEPHPFYLTAEEGYVVYVGIHVGRVIEDGQEVAFYSPWEGVRDDLDLALDR